MKLSMPDFCSSSARPEPVLGASWSKVSARDFPFKRESVTDIKGPWSPCLQYDSERVLNDHPLFLVIFLCSRGV